MFIMLGYESETVQDLEETVEHLKISNPDLFLTTVAYPIKGTPYYHEVESRILTDKNWTDRSDRDLTVAGRYSRRRRPSTSRSAQPWLRKSRLSAASS